MGGRTHTPSSPLAGAHRKPRSRETTARFHWNLAPLPPSARPGPLASFGLMAALFHWDVPKPGELSSVKLSGSGAAAPPPPPPRVVANQLTTGTAASRGKAAAFGVSPAGLGGWSGKRNSRTRQSRIRAPRLPYSWVTPFCKVMEHIGGALPSGPETALVWAPGTWQCAGRIRVIESRAWFHKTSPEVEAHLNEAVHRRHPGPTLRARKAGIVEGNAKLIRLPWYRRRQPTKMSRC